MLQHARSISHELPEPQREPSPDPPRGNFFRGFLFALLFSLPLWALIIWGVYELLH